MSVLQQTGIQKPENIVHHKRPSGRGPNNNTFRLFIGSHHGKNAFTFRHRAYKFHLNPWVCTQLKVKLFESQLFSSRDTIHKD